MNWSIPISADFQFQIFQFNSNSIHAELNWIDYQFQFNSWIDPSPVYVVCVWEKIDHVITYNNVKVTLRLLLTCEASVPMTVWTAAGFICVAPMTVCVVTMEMPAWSAFIPFSVMLSTAQLKSSCCADRMSSVDATRAPVVVTSTSGSLSDMVKEEHYLEYRQSFSIVYWRFGPRLNIKTVFPRYGDSHVKDKMVKRHLYIETTPRAWVNSRKRNRQCSHIGSHGK